MVTEVRQRLGVGPTCAAVGLPRATYYRQRWPKHGPPRRRTPARRLAAAERQGVLEVLHEPRFVDVAPLQVWATLLDEGIYLCSPRTMHRILAENAESRDRRNQLRHPQYTAPQLLATKPNELWSWDITKLLGPQKWTYYYLYVLLDVFSRYVVGWLIADCESATLAKRLIEECCKRQGIEPGQLTVHADRGPAATSKAVAHLLADLGVTKTHSRPHVSNDNPFSEAQFKTMKYRPEFPERFGCPEHARACSRDFFDWYNLEHHHSALGLLTPYEVHHGHADARRDARVRVLEAAHRDHPERFVHGVPQPPALPTAVWINPPAEAAPGAAVALEPRSDRARDAGAVPGPVSALVAH
jgi:putative transposase